MKFTNLLLLVFIFNFISHINPAAAQQVILSTGFNGYIGTAATAPSGWYLSFNSTGGAAGASYYNTAGNFGISSPSHRMGITNDTLISPPFSGADTVSFWLKAVSGAFSDSNTVSLFESPDSMNWTLVESIDSISSTATIMKKPLNAGTTHIMFTYIKILGSSGIDDIKVTHYVPGIPVADFISAGACQGDSVHFTDATIIYNGNITNWTWDFGDGSALSTNQNPAHLYSGSSMYNVKLVAQDNTGDLDSVTLPVQVYDLPSVLFSTPLTTICAGTRIHFADSSTVANGSITVHAWDYGDGFTSTQHNPNHTFSTPGTYDVQLTETTNFGCSTTVTIPGMIIVNPIPTAAFGVIDSSGTLVFTNSSLNAVSYSWDFDDGTPLDTNQNATHIFSSDSVYYHVCLTATNSYGCTDVLCDSINVTGINPVPEINYFTVSPNPTKGIINICSKNMNSGHPNIHVYNVLGEELRIAENTEWTINSIRVNLSALPDGFYFIRISNMKYSVTERFILVR